MMLKNTVNIRHANINDADDVLRLMTELAEFEGYAKQFVVTLKELKQRLFKQQDFCVLVAECDAKLLGILVYYYLPFTYDLKPWIYIKELFVDADYRSQNIGQQLMHGLAQEAKIQGCTKIRWDVLSSNERAKAFYQSLGAQHDEDWLLFSLNSDALSKLVLA